MKAMKTLKAFFTCKACGKRITRNRKLGHRGHKGGQRGGGCGCGANGLFSGGGRRRRKSIKKGGMPNKHVVTGGGTGYLNPATFPDDQMPSGSYYPYDTALGGDQDPLSPSNITDTRLVPEFNRTPDIMSGGGGSNSMLSGVPQSVNNYNAGTSSTIFEKTVGGRRKRRASRRRRNRRNSMKGGLSSELNNHVGMNPYSAISSAIHGGENNIAFGSGSAFGSIYSAGQPPQVA